MQGILLSKTWRRPISALAKYEEPAPQAAQPRARGTALLQSKLRGTASVLDDFRLSGSSRVLFPKRADQTLEAVLLNTSGGLTGGDVFATEIIAGENSHLIMTTQAAERAYCSNDIQPARVRTNLTLKAGSKLDWLPQETILFEGSSIDRELSIDMASDARLLLVEPMIFGRLAMGETLRQANLFDRISLRRDGKLEFVDRVRLSGDIHAQLDRTAIATGARAMASVLIASPDAERHLDPLRALLPPSCGASLIQDGLLFARLLAVDSHALRQILIPALRLLRGADLPRTWML